ncbi:MAG TPA: pyridoxal phosphate-dependent aminotransferase, partial [Thermoanaerobaculia bacterium]|nr:pyridoxal phosphate-dependent aminotransferase [Thermoanaerobaculia bacterium]
KKLAHYNNLHVDSAKEIVVTVGSSGGFLTAAMATLNAGDEVILFEPYYGYHLNTLAVLGFVPKFVPLHAPDWSIDWKELRAAFTPKTRAIVICTPSNPSGKMFTREELENIAALCRERDAWIFTDEIYEYIVYDGRRHVSIASLPECRDITVTISGFSKTFSITGWRIGYAVADARVAGPIGLMNDLFAICAPTPLQWGVARALEVPDAYYRNLAADYQKKRDILAGALEEAGFKPSIPQGSYYMLAGIPDEFRNDKEAAQSLLEGARVASVPGSAFFVSDEGKRMLRFCFAKDFAALEEACRRIRAFRAARV